MLGNVKVDLRITLLPGPKHKGSCDSEYKGCPERPEYFLAGLILFPKSFAQFPLLVLLDSKHIKEEIKSTCYKHVSEKNDQGNHDRSSKENKWIG